MEACPSAFVAYLKCTFIYSVFHNMASQGNEQIPSKTDSNDQVLDVFTLALLPRRPLGNLKAI